jgi:hypothetical protein
VDSFRNCWWRKCGASRRRRWNLSWGVLCFFVTLFLIGVWRGRTSEFAIFGLLTGAGISIKTISHVVIDW